MRAEEGVGPFLSHLGPSHFFTGALMELLLYFWDLLVHLDQHLANLVLLHGAWVYLLLFLIVFCETGLVVTPFLPGDSLLFIAGALAAKDSGSGQLDLATLNMLLIAAAVLGNTTNY